MARGPVGGCRYPRELPNSIVHCLYTSKECIVMGYMYFCFVMISLADGFHRESDTWHDYVITTQLQRFRGKRSFTFIFAPLQQYNFQKFIRKRWKHWTTTGHSGSSGETSRKPQQIYDWSAESDSGTPWTPYFATTAGTHILKGCSCFILGLTYSANSRLQPENLAWRRLPQLSLFFRQRGCMSDL